MSGCIHHIDLTVTDMARSTAFYERLLPLLGWRRRPEVTEVPVWQGEQVELALQLARQASWRPHDRYAPGLHHLAFAAPDRASVDRIHRELCQFGVPILDPPALYEKYAPGYYAVFFKDPDGMKLEYVYTPSAES